MSDFITNGELRIEAERLCDENEQLKAENDNLRELVQKMMRFFEDGDWCIKCEVEEECDAQQYEGDCLMRGVFRNRMRELGIEEDA